MTTEPPTESRGRHPPTPAPPIPKDYDRLEPLYSIQTVLAQPTGIEDACDELFPIVARVLRIRTAVLLDTTPGSERDLVWAADGIDPDARKRAHDHAATTLAYLTRRLAATTAASQFVTLPLVLRGEIFGVFQLEGAPALDERDLLFMNVVVNQLAVALDRRHIQLELEARRADVEQANRRLRQLHEISEAALEGAGLDESLAAVLRALRATFAADVAAVLLASSDGTTLETRATIGMVAVEERPVVVGEGAAGRIAAAETAMCFEDLDASDGASPTLRSNGIRSLLGAPMRARKHLVGVVYVASREHRAFAREELQLVQLAADRIGTIIDNAKLYEKALAAIASRDVVMGVVSHDLKTPLTAILLSLEVLAAIDPANGASVARIRRSIAAMTRLIGDLRDIGSIEAGHLSIRAQPEPAAGLVREAVEGVQDLAASRSLRLTMRLPADGILVACDRVRTVQVLTNLLTNAIKFTPDGGAITVSMEPVPGFCRFAVEDTGCGMPEEDLPHVFDRYWQAEKTAHLGNGLGLAIAKSIVDAHGGTMSVESRVGHGTTFSFTLPLAHEPSRTAGRVLLVDDEPNTLLALASLLVEQGFVVETAPDASAALARLREFTPEILVVDVEMPGLRGPDLVRKVRKDLAEIPVIFISGHREEDEDFVTTRLALHATYIAKPVDIDALVSSIHRSIDHRA